MTIDGLTTIAGSFGPNETLEKLETDIAEHGMSVMARVDHATAAAKVGTHLTSDDIGCFRQSEGGHGHDAIRANHGHRPALEGARLGRQRPQDLVVVQ